MRAPDAPEVSVIVPTFRRPQLLRRALEALEAQTLWEWSSGEIVVVDNCPGKSAQQTVAALPSGRVPVHYVAEPRPGISHARNKGLEVARGRMIAFVDDDNLITETSLSALRTALEETGCSAAFGRIVGLPDTACPPECLYFIGPYSRELGEVRRDITDERAYLGACLSLFRRPVLAERSMPFDPALGLIGGEDSALLQELAEEGHRFVFEPAAVGFELVPPARLNRGSMQRRRFRSGQIRAANAGSGMRRAVWIGVGILQVVLHAPAAGLSSLLGLRQRAETHRGQAWGGLGKLLWHRKKPPFYGGDIPPAEAGSPASS
jgi:glycosyltransferase involved in cell wall biosynthesis